MKHRTTAMLAFAVALGLIMATVAGCSGTAGGTDKAEASRVTITDLASRTVEVPAKVSKVVAIGPGALRLVCYAGAADKVVGIENIELKKPVQRPYLMANPSLLKLPVIGPGGPDSTPDAEHLVEVAPDVIFVAYLVDKAAADELQKATNIPVVVLSYGQLATFGDDLFSSIETVGKVAGTSERADKTCSFIKSTMADLQSRTASGAVAGGPTAYVGALGFKGIHGIESSSPDYPPFTFIGAKNVATGVKAKFGGAMIDKEQLLRWDPDYIFLDRGGLSLVQEDIGKNRSLYENLSAFKNRHVYAQIPFNNYTTNIETALGNAYYAGTVMYPQQFSDVDPGVKLDEISQEMLGAPVYAKLSEVFGGGFGNLNLLDSN